MHDSKGDETEPLLLSTWPQRASAEDTDDGEAFRRAVLDAARRGWDGGEEILAACAAAGEEGGTLHSDIRAQCSFGDVVTDEGEILETEVFAMPFIGLRRDIEALFANPAFLSAVDAAFAAHPVFGHGGSVALLTRPVDPFVLFQGDPVALYDLRIAMVLSRALQPGTTDDFSRLAEKIATDQFHGSRAVRGPGARLLYLVGTYIIAADASDAAAADEESDVLGRWRSGFLDVMGASANALGVGVGYPVPYTDASALGHATLLHAMLGAEFEASNPGRAAPDQWDALHVHDPYRDGTFLVSALLEGRAYGPVALDHAVLDPVFDEFSSHLGDISKHGLFRDAPGEARAGTLH